MRKTFTIFMAMALLLSIVLAGCSSSDKTSSKEEKESGKTTIRILSRMGGDDPESKAFNELLDKFMKENPDIKVVDESLNDEAAFNNKFKTSVATGNVPEIWVNYGGQAFKEYAKNIAMDLTPVLEEDKQWSDAFLPLFDTWKYDDLPGVYGVPSEFYSIALFYNKELFEKIGAEPPKYIEDIPELQKKFAKEDITLLRMGDKENFRGGHLISNITMKKFGLQKTEDLVSGKAKYTDKDMLEIFKIMKQWADLGVFGDNIVTTDDNEVTSAFTSGKSAMLFNGSWGISSLAESDIADKIGVIPFPGFKDAPDHLNAWHGGAGGYSVFKEIKGKKKDAAIKLVKYLTSVDAFQYYFEKAGGGVYPVKMDMDSLKVDPVTQEYTKALESSSEFLMEITAYDPRPQFQDKLRNEIQGMFAGNSPEKTAENIQKFSDNLK
ncbi:ABC transporter substrate-binding protein [Neobacillus kokaensis]|uniref:ABC transporter substrate-binding protein n=1 Tax=Neobacillus kokaensis TaxID=2759023 RepID=A0ABQ3NAY4_9BACI|nr:extracellular solute-binding protein [Neobacillus kokaensis]GHI01068.1 hypothetical protein AM1BK_46100 [Neobacillus kokaensis]